VHGTYEEVHVTVVPVVHVFVAHSVAPMKILGVTSASAKFVPGSGTTCGHSNPQKSIPEHMP
jgi:hypothetical protein